MKGGQYAILVGADGQRTVVDVYGNTFAED